MTRASAVMIFSLILVVTIHYLWLMLGSSVFAATALSNPDGQLEKVGDITRAEDDSARLGSYGQANLGAMEQSEQWLCQLSGRQRCAGGLLRRCLYSGTGVQSRQIPDVG